MMPVGHRFAAGNGMRKLLNAIVMVFGAGVLAAVVLLALAWWKTGRDLARTYSVADLPLSIRRDPGTLLQGAHIYATRGCVDCHGGDGGGKLVFDAGPVIRVVGPNITPAGVAKGMSADQLAAVIRHGVKPDGHPLVFMPSGDFQALGDADTAALVAYVQAMRPVSHDPGKTRIRPLGYVLYLFGRFPLIPAARIDHAPRARTAPEPAPTPAYGRYLAQACTGCHGPGLAGQHVPGTPPSFPTAQDLTPGNLAAWTQDDFRRALRTGKRPDGSTIDPFMPWRNFAQMNDVEIAALWAYLRSLPAFPPHSAR